MPIFSFGKSERFPNMYKFKENDSKDKNDLFVDGNFDISDKQSFLKTQNFMGSGPKGNNVKYNGVPGPGYYKIPCSIHHVPEFADKNINEEFKYV